MSNLPETSIAKNRVRKPKNRLLETATGYKDSPFSHPSKIASKLEGQKFGRLLVIKRIGISKYGKIIWECLCDCGNTTHVISYHLKIGKIVSCGCVHKEMLIKRNLKHGQSCLGKHTAEFQIWQNMKSRCLNPLNNHFKRYGDRGIKVCDRWLNSFENFFSDMGNRPSKIHTIDRINNDGNYEPDNCKWSTPAQQTRNTSRNRWFEYGGDKKVLSDWATELKCLPSQIIYHLSKGKDFGAVVSHLKQIKQKT